MPGSYEIVRSIGRGGMAEVFLATRRESGIEKRYAIKQLLPAVADDAAAVEMFLREGRVAAALNHPNLCKVYEVGAEGGQYFLAMEYLSGQTLARTLARLQKAGKRLPPPLAASIAAAAAEGLAYAHEAKDASGSPLGLVHRDVSPENVFLTYDGQVKVLDFGIALTQGRRALTKQGLVRGKAAYMAPEQLRGETLDARCDVFALGTCLHEMLAGKPLFEGETATGAPHHALTVPIPDLGADPSVPPELAEIARRALELDRDKRLGTAREMARSLSAWTGTCSPAPDARALGQFVRKVFADDLAQAAREPAPRLGRMTDALPRPRVTDAIAAVPEERRDRRALILIAALLLAVPLGLLFWNLYGRVAPRRNIPPAIVTHPQPPAPRPVSPALPVQPAPPPRVSVEEPVVGLAGYWSFDNCEGAVVADDSGHRRGGTFWGGYACTDGKVGKAAAFDGNKLSVRIPDHPSFHARDAVTLMAWVRPQGRGNIASRWYAPDSFGLSFDGSRYSFTCAFSVEGGAATVSARAEGALDRWTHVAGVYDGKSVKLYLDGILKDETPASGELQQTTMPLMIGSHPEWSALKAAIDEVALYNVALPPELIARIAASPAEYRCSAGSCAAALLGSSAPPAPMAVADPKPQGSGWLSLDTTPWTTVYLGDKKLGITPLVRVELPAGHYSLHAVNKGRQIDKTVEVDVPAGAEIAQEFTW